jgi:hypothetical protein
VESGRELLWDRGRLVEAGPGGLRFFEILGSLGLTIAQLEAELRTVVLEPAAPPDVKPVPVT